MAQVEVARGSQRLSGFDFETIFITCCVPLGIFVCFFGEKGFVNAVWYLDFGLLMHFNMVAASHCSLHLLFSISFGRGLRPRR